MRDFRKCIGRFTSNFPGYRIKIRFEIPGLEQDRKLKLLS